MPEFDFLSQNVPYIGVPVYVVVIMGATIFILWLVMTRKPRHAEYKPINVKKETKKALRDLYDSYSVQVGKPLYRGGIEIGHVKGFMPLIWSKSISLKDNLIMNKKREVTDAVLQVQGKDPKAAREIVNMKAVLVGNRSPFKRLLSIGDRYHIIEDELMTTEGDTWIINSSAQPSMLYGNVFYSSLGRKVLEDVSYKINRENELQELGNAVPRVVFWDNEFAKRAMIERERADIEKERFKGQKESAEE